MGILTKKTRKRRKLHNYDAGGIPFRHIRAHSEGEAKKIARRYVKVRRS